jgi:hypothetical protein
MTDAQQFPKPVSVTIWLIIILGCAVLVGLLWFNPEQHAIFPVCPLHRFTGWNCPGCGGLRAVHHLLHGRWSTAFHCNPLFVSMLPVAVVLGVRALLQKRAGRFEIRNWARPAVLYAGAGVMILFGILRNLPYPAFRWMSP